MTRRSINWNEGLAKDLRNVKFAQSFIQTSLEEGLSIQVVLGKVIRAYGVKEFANKVKISSSNLVRILDPKYNPTLDTLNRLLKPFSLQVTIARSTKNRAA
jgi:DNA-binding phage protein